MKVIWIKDGNIGHEKQVKVLLNELSKSQNLVIDERSIKGSFPFFRYIDPIEDKYYDIIIGAGHKTYSFLLDIKKKQKIETKTIAVLAPSIKRNKFDIICAPEHDKKKLDGCNEVITFEGSLSKVSFADPDMNTILIGIGGKNKHYKFDSEHLLSQIHYFLSINPNKKCYIFNSRRTPSLFTNELRFLDEKNKDITFCDFKNHSISFEDILHKSSSKLISRDSVNMIYESLSCRGNTYLLDMKSKKQNNKIVRNINNLIINKKVGYIDCSNLIEGMSKMKICKQNEFNEVFAEVEKVAFKLNKIL